MTKNEARDLLWELHYRAAMNHCYHESMYRKWSRIDLGLRTFVVLLAVGSAVAGLAALVAQPSMQVNIAGVAIAVIALALALMIELLLVTSLCRFHESMQSRWRDLLGDCRETEVDVRSIADETMPPRVATAVKDLNSTMTAIEKDESTHPPNKYWLRQAQREINKRTYGVAEGTYEEVMRSLGKAA